MEVVKRHKRLHVMDGERSVYSLPSFMQVPNREAVRLLAAQLEQGRGIAAVMEFEAAFHPKRKARTPLPW
jgi:hypothetical protein